VFVDQCSPPLLCVLSTHRGSGDEDRFLCGVVQLGAYPLPTTEEDDEQRTGMNLAPVDFVARAIVHLSLQRGAAVGRGVGDGSVTKTVPTYHFVNYNHARKETFLLWSEVVDHLLSFGYADQLEGLPYSEWRQRLMRAVDNTKAGQGSAVTHEGDREEERRCPALVSLRSYFQGSSLPFRAKEYSFDHTLRYVSRLVFSLSLRLSLFLVLCSSFFAVDDS
jgi:hypothetical protein